MKYLIRVFAVVVCALTVITLLPSSTEAAINPMISFQGKLTNPDGTNVTDGSISIRFRIYTDPTADTGTCANTCKWEETQGTVVVSGGLFNVNLGSVTTLPGSVDFNGSALYLGVKVSTDAEMTPRVRLTAAPYAFNSDTLDGLDSAAFVQLSSGNINIGVGTVTSGAVNGVTIGGTIQPSAAGALTVRSTGSNALNLTGGAASTWDIGNNILSLQTTNNGAITTGSGLWTQGGNLTFNGTAARTITGPATGGLTVTVAAGPLTLSTTGSGTLAVTSAGALNLTGGGASTVSTGVNTLQVTSSNFNVSTAGAITAATSTNTINNLVINNGSLTNVGANITASGALTVASGGAGALILDSASNTIQLAANDTTIQKTAAGTTTLNLVDGSNTILSVTNSGAGSALINADGGFQVNGTPGASTTCSGGQFLQNQVVSGGLTTGGTCVAGGGSSDLDGAYDADGDKILAVDSTTGILFNLTTTGDFIIQDNGTAVLTLSDSGTLLFKPSADDALALDVQKAGSSTQLFTIDSTNDRIYVGDSTADATGTVLVLDTKNSAGDPTSSIDGAMYYNSDSKSFRCRHNALWQDCDFASLRAEWVVQEDFTTNTITAGTASDLGNIGDKNWTFVSIGTGGTLAKVDVGGNASDQDRFGVLRLNSPATTNTGVHLRLDNTGMTGVPSNMLIEYAFGPVNAAAATGQQQIIRIGAHDSATNAAPTDGIYFQYSTTTTTGNWFRCTRNNSAETCTDTAVAYTTTANQYQRFRIQTNSAGTSAEFFINEVSVGTNSTNMPAAARSYGPTINVNTVDATIRQWKIDYYQIKRNLTTLR